jgi:hypothetical protein
VLSPTDKEPPRADRRSRWFASIDGRYSFASQDLEYYLYTSFVVIIALLGFLAVVLPDLKLIIRFVCSFVRYSNLTSPRAKSSSSSSSSSTTTSSAAHATRSWCCRVVGRYAGQRRTFVCLFSVAIIVLAGIYSLPLLHSAISPPSPHLPLSYFVPPTPSVVAPSPAVTATDSSVIKMQSEVDGLSRFPSSVSDAACPATVVTALYDIGRGNKAHGQEKEQSWNNYLRYFHHVLHGAYTLHACEGVA